MINEELYNQEDVELLDGVADGADEGDEMYEHFAVTVDKGQSQMRLDKYLTPDLAQAKHFVLGQQL